MLDISALLTYKATDEAGEAFPTHTCPFRRTLPKKEQGGSHEGFGVTLPLKVLCQSPW